MRVCSLGSGSKGNAAVVTDGATSLLIDCGLSARTLLGRLAERGMEPKELDAILITHEHIDHVRGLERLREKSMQKAAVHMTRGTARKLKLAASAYKPICPQEPFLVGSLEVTPYPVPHDASEPVQFMVRNGASRAGFLTDAGSVTAHATRVLSECDLLVVECNYDIERLRANPSYPQRLKTRISGSHGHLGNGEARELLQKLAARRLRHVVAAHLSEENNLPQLAAAAIRECLPKGKRIRVTVATQKEGFDWVDV